MQYLAALDYEHLDNSIFLSALAKNLSRQHDVRPIIIHADSTYTERVIQTGVMREDAEIRSIKDLNHRLVALFADQGISAIGINGYQRALLTLEDDRLSLDHDYFATLPEEPVLLLSSLVLNKQTDSPQPIALPRLALFLQEQLHIEHLFIFSSSDSDEIMKEHNFTEEATWNKLESDFLDEKIPDEFHDFKHPLRLTTAQNFGELPALKSSMFIH